jgi:hypothetical protein
MVVKKDTDTPSVHPLVEQLLASGEGQTLLIGGYVGPASEGRVRIFADLGLRTYIELAKSDIVRVIDSSSTTQGPSTILIKRDAELVLVQRSTLRADQAIAAAIAVPAMQPSGGCGCGEQSTAPLARQSGGGPVIDLCSWACVERLQLCLARSGTLGRLWCYLSYGSCRLGCIDPPIILV